MSSSRHDHPQPGILGPAHRVGGQLIELTLSAAGETGLPDGLSRALRIAEVAVARILNG